MRKGYLIGLPGSFLCLIILTLAACNSNQTSATSADTPVAKVDTPVKAAAPMAMTGGDLNILYVDAATFIDINKHGSKKMTFRFFMPNPNSITLSNWSNDAGSPKFPDPSNLTLSIGAASPYTYGSGTYFGNLVLYNSQISQLITKIKNTNATSVLFVPMDPTTTGGQISYYVIPLSTTPLTLKYDDLKPLFLTADQTNPSPPRGAFN